MKSVKLTLELPADYYRLLQACAKIKGQTEREHAELIIRTVLEKVSDTAKDKVNKKTMIQKVFG